MTMPIKPSVTRHFIFAKMKSKGNFDGLYIITRNALSQTDQTSEEKHERNREIRI